LIQKEIDTIIQFHGWLPIVLKMVMFELEDVPQCIFKHKSNCQSIGNLHVEEMIPNKKVDNIDYLDPLPFGKEVFVSESFYKTESNVQWNLVVGEETTNHSITIE
jgi:hypothetical protein